MALILIKQSRLSPKKGYLHKNIQAVLTVVKLISFIKVIFEPFQFYWVNKQVLTAGLTWGTLLDHHCSTCYPLGCACREFHCSQSVSGWSYWPSVCFCRHRNDRNFKSRKNRKIVNLNLKLQRKLTCESPPEKNFDCRILCSNPRQRR